MRLREDTETAAAAALKFTCSKTRTGRGEHIYRAFGAVKVGMPNLTGVDREGVFKIYVPGKA